MDSMDMGGMDTPGMFTTENQYRAKIFWYVIAAFVATLTLVRIGAWLQGTKRRREKVVVPQGSIEQYIATSTAIYRELVYPQPVWFSGRFSKYFTPPSVGKCLLLACYWIMVLTLVFEGVLLEPNDPMHAYKYEKPAFRAAWISISQIPFIYLLSCKFNPISILTGISYERFNWLHRWAARTVFITVAIHWAYFFKEWMLADFVEYEFEVMGAMIKYGFGAWAVIGWMIVSGFGFFRAAGYELFVLQHIFAAATLLWLLYVHVPAYAAYNIWLAVGFVAFDWGARIVLGIARNTHLLSKFWTQLPGYSARLEPLTEDMVKLTIDKPDFTWKAGQHVYITMPSVRPLELHPFTIASNAIAADSSQQPLTLLIKAHSGFSRSLHKCAEKDTAVGRARRVFLSWPMGIPPDVSHYDTVVLVACSTGITFVLPILQDLIRHRGCIRRIELHWTIKDHQHHAWVAEALDQAMQAAQANGLCLHISVHVTRFQASSSSLSSSSVDLPDSKIVMRMDSNSSSEASVTGEKDKEPFLNARPVHTANAASLNVMSIGRPSIESLIRPAVETAIGETAIVACGGLSFTAQIRTFVAHLSDERAVHKGSGAQGIFLFTETYGW